MASKKLATYHEKERKVKHMKNLICVEGGLIAKAQGMLVEGNGYEIGARIYEALVFDLEHGFPLEGRELAEILEAGFEAEPLPNATKELKKAEIFKMAESQASWIWKVVLPKNRVSCSFQLFGKSPEGKTYHEKFELSRKELRARRDDKLVDQILGIRGEGNGKDTSRIKAFDSRLRWGSEELKAIHRENSKRQFRDAHGKFVKKNS